MWLKKQLACKSSQNTFLPLGLLAPYPNQLTNRLKPPSKSLKGLEKITFHFLALQSDTDREETTAAHGLMLSPNNKSKKA
jgi:hypothetical protein